ncbi:MAG: NAD/NADP octopine/nopaline dehydrogenase family protein [Candidatus Latescibacteria bacterium]|nr:NAD/NADP octopine/nopaline dehydrogenase family protein [Candidatus Latescibacterota bacterium]
MYIHKFIVDKAIILDLKNTTKHEVYQELTDALKNAGRLSNPEQAVKDLQTTERKGTFGIGQAIAIPHACTSAVHQPIIAIGISKTGIDFNAVDDKPVNLVFLVLNRLIGHNFQLKILSRLAHLLNAPIFAETLLQAKSSYDMLNYIKEQETPLGEIEPPEDTQTVCIIGAGNGGLAMAAHLAITGRKVNLYNRTENRIRTIQASNEIEVTGEINGTAKLNLVTTDIKQALTDADIVMVVVPALGHIEIARIMGPHLSDGQIVLLNPGRTGGALVFAETLRQLKINKYYFLAEAETLLYASRITNPGQVRIFGIKNAVPIATLPAFHLPDVLASLRNTFHQFVAGDNVLKTGLSNIGAIFHPALTVLNTAWIENEKGEFSYYHEGASPSVSLVLEALDAERIKVAEAVGIRVLSAREWLYQAYGVAGNNLYEAIQANYGYHGIMAPNTIDHRYIAEDVPTSLVPIASLGEYLGVKVTTMKSIVQLANVLHNRNYWTEGRTVDKLGLDGMTVRQIRRYVEEGRRNGK